ncbi:MAG: hypothetical protein K6U74_07045, partial [Firmicutes bacterium]|nr:hypothetical protein [Bacillota bacterium]
MPAVMIYVPGGKLNRRTYEGAQQQADALQRALGYEIVGTIQVDGFDQPETDQDQELARRFSILAAEGRPVIAIISAKKPLEAYWRLASVLPPDTPVVHPSRLAIIGAVERPRTPEEWE